MKEKKCKKCERVLPLGEFNKNKTKKDGLQGKCKKCVAEYNRKYYEANNEKVKDNSRKYYEANKEKIAERDRKYREANKEKIAERDRKYYEANKEKIAECHREYKRERRKNDTDFRAILTIRRQMGRIDKMGKRSLEIYGVPNRELAIKIDREKLEIYNKYFKGVKKHLDHIRPLAEVKHSVEEMHRRSHFTNLVYIPAEVNLSKGATPFWEWFAGLKDEKLKKCIAEQDEYNKKIQRQFDANT